MTFELLHVVKRYGPVGGMENYVWDLTQALARRGHSVTVLCEQVQALDTGEVKTIEVGASRERPRWLSHMRFAATVEAWLKVNPSTHRIIHSHERMRVHHVTTFHSLPFLHPRRKPGLLVMVPRIHAQLHLERRELMSDSVRAIVPVSSVVGDALRIRYPAAAGRITAPVHPAVRTVPARPARIVPVKGGVIGFIGREWKRKGLPFAVEVVTLLAQARPDLEFVVCGPDPGEIGHLFRRAPFRHRLVGWLDASEMYPALDLLLHPAKEEAFGMVLTEALAAGVPVVSSNVCGAAEVVRDHGGAVLDLRQTVAEWTAACDGQFGHASETAAYRRSADQLAEEYAGVYREVTESMEDG